MFEEDLTEMTDRQLLERIARDSRRAKLTSITSFYAILVGIVITAWGISKVTEALLILHQTH